MTALSSWVKGLGCLESALISFKDKAQSAWQFITVYYSDLRSYPRCVMKSHREAAGSHPFPLHTSGCLGYAFNLRQKQRMCSFNKYLLPPGNGPRHGKGVPLPLSKALLSMAVQLLLCPGAEHGAPVLRLHQPLQPAYHPWLLAFANQASPWRAAFTRCAVGQLTSETGILDPNCRSCLRKRWELMT